MRQPLSTSTRWVVAGLFAVIARGASAGGFLEINGNFSPIDDPGAAYTNPHGINDADQIVGDTRRQLASGVGDVRGFLYVGGTFSRINVPGSHETIAYGINNAGQIVGSFQDSSRVQHGFLYAGGTFSTIDVPGSVETIASGINNAGQIVGTFVDSSERFFRHSFLYANGTFTTIDSPPPVGTPHPITVPTIASGINDAGHIVGNIPGLVPSGGFIYVDGIFGNFGAPPPAVVTIPTGINNSDQIVGHFFAGCCFPPDGPAQGFLYTGGTFSTIVPNPDDVHAESYAEGINNAGHIVGIVGAIPEPESLVLFSVGLLGLGLAWRRRVSAHLC